VTGWKARRHGRPDGFDWISELLEMWHLRATVDASPRACGAWQLNTSGDGKRGFPRALARVRRRTIAGRGN